MHQIVLNEIISFVVEADFVITDQTEYYFNVDEIAAETLYSQHNRLFCIVHPTLIFNKVIYYKALDRSRKCVSRELIPIHIFRSTQQQLLQVSPSKLLTF